MPSTTVLIALGVVRIVGGLGLLVGVATFGYRGCSLRVLPFLAAVFTVSFGVGKWRAWEQASQTCSTLGQALLGQCGTYVIQLILVSIMYLIGRGVGSLAGVVAPAAAAAGTRTDLTSVDEGRLALFAAFALVVGLLIVALDYQAQRHVVSARGLPKADALAAPTLDPRSITETTFWNGHHYSHKDDHVYDKDRERVLVPERAYLDESKMAAEETRLGIPLPPRLRRLYALQNGGQALALWVPCDKPRMTNACGGWINPFSGYDCLIPLTTVRSLLDTISDYAQAEEDPEMFPPNSHAMIVLAQWYRETLFLDYRHGDNNNHNNPRVGFVDLDDYDDLRTNEWEADALWWDDFETFFTQLRGEVGRRRA
jgi:hypothetical protein